MEAGPVRRGDTTGSSIRSPDRDPKRRRERQAPQAMLRRRSLPHLYPSAFAFHESVIALLCSSTDGKNYRAGKSLGVLLAREDARLGHVVTGEAVGSGFEMLKTW